jgi:hypothetical protein
MFSNPPISPFRKGGVNMFITYLKIKIYEITTTNRHSRPRLHEGKLRRESMFFKVFNGPPTSRG